MNWSITAAIAVTAVSVLPAMAGDTKGEAPGSDDHHARAATTSPDSDGQQCSSAVSRAKRTVENIDGGVRIVFESDDAEVLKAIASLALQGKILGSGPDGKPVKRKLRREKSRVILTAAPRTEVELREIREIASRLAGPKPLCGTQLAVTTRARPAG